ncbi:MAG: hypothetical protein JSV12_00805 [Candidatus Bathyarchaeota archaeon]|nr:MAG: hypothetical protein JSV12_00805 [Candidatus Bathyarchaeota archaeon]
MIFAFAVNLIGQELTDPFVGQLLNFVLGLLILTVVFYLAGRVVVGKKRALFSDAFVISLLGTVVANIVSLLIPSTQLIGLILSLIIWLFLIRHYYETGWLGAFAVAVLAVIIDITIMFILFLLLAIPFLLVGG